MNRPSYVEVDTESGKILGFFDRPLNRPDPVYKNSELYEVVNFPENFTHFIEGMIFDPNTKTLMHSAETLEFYQEVLAKLNYQLNCCP